MRTDGISVPAGGALPCSSRAHLQHRREVLLCSFVILFPPVPTSPQTITQATAVASAHSKHQVQTARSRSTAARLPSLSWGQRGQNPATPDHARSHKSVMPHLQHRREVLLRRLVILLLLLLPLAARPQISAPQIISRLRPLVFDFVLIGVKPVLGPGSIG